MDDAENQPPWMHGGAGANLASTRAHAHTVPSSFHHTFLSSSPTSDSLSQSRHHDSSVSSIGIECELAMDPDRLKVWLMQFQQSRGADIYRLKGYFNMHGWSERFVFHGVHMLFQGAKDRLWRPDEQRKSVLVLIGKNLDRAAITKQFYECVAVAPTAKFVP